MSNLGTSMLAAIAVAGHMSLPVSDRQSAFSDRYEEMGTIQARVGEATYRLIVPYDIVHNRPHAEQRMIFGSVLTISVLAHMYGTDGTPERPMLQITLQQRGDTMELVSAELLDGKGYAAPLVMGGDGGQGDVVSFSLDGNMMTGRIEGDFLRLEGHLPDRSVADGAAPLPSRLDLKVALPPLD